MQTQEEFKRKYEESEKEMKKVQEDYKRQTAATTTKIDELTKAISKKKK